jgi:hypothetical protein
MRWVVTCRHCAEEVLRARRSGDAELAALRDHVRQHPSERLADDAGVEATLKPFTVAACDWETVA